MRLMLQLEVQEDFVVLLPGDSFSDAKTCYFKLPVFHLPSVRNVYVFSSLMYNIASEMRLQ